MFYTRTYRIAYPLLHPQNKMTRNSKKWAPSSSRQTKPKVSDSIKSLLKEKADEIVENVIKPNHISPPPTDHDFNYLVDIYTKWYRNYFYFCSKYNCPSPNAISPSFEVKYARMEYVGNDKFNVSYMRHTEKWGEIYQEISMLESLKVIAEEPYFAP